MQAKASRMPGSKQTPYIVQPPSMAKVWPVV